MQGLYNSTIHMPVKKISKEAIQIPKGTHDIVPVDAPYWEHVACSAEAMAQFYGFEKIETPHFEKTDLFLHTLGETTDIIEKQMYSFRTRGGDSLTLRPEGTAGIARSYIENGMHTLPQPVKVFYYGSFFRHENPQRGRFREFRQFGLEILGADDPVTDAEIIQIFYCFLTQIGFQNIAVQINSIGDEESRAAYRKELVAFYKRRFNSLCKDCKRRLKDNPLRLLDCKEHMCMDIREEAPQMIKSLSEQSRRRFRLLLEFLDEAKVTYFINPYLVRGLDYYTETVFEIFINCEDGSVEILEEDAMAEAQNQLVKPAPVAVASGGRYDGLIKMLGGKPTPAVGGAMGVDRVILEMKNAGIVPPAPAPRRVFLVQLGPAAKKKAFVLMETFRKAGIPLAEATGKDSIKSQLKIASKVEALYALILGQKEALDNTIIVRRLDTGEQETVSQSVIIDEIKSRLKGRK